MRNIQTHKMLKWSSITLVLVGLLAQVQAQLRVDKVIPPSFNAAALIKYCDHPVGHKYGVPKTRFLIKTLVNQDLYIPIALNYHAVGIKVEEEATWVGLGWYLNAGGLITRIIRGENDFGVVENKDGAKGYPFEHIKPCFDNCEKNENANFHAKVCNGTLDSDPDIFFFDLLGSKGKFLMTPDHDSDKEYIEIRIVTPRKMNIKFYIQQNYWVVTDMRGYKFTLKTKEITESYENYFDYKFSSHKLHFLENWSNATSSWYLDKVQSPKGATAQFVYDTNSMSSSPYTSNSTHHKMNINDQDIWDLHYSSYCFPKDIENVQVVSSNKHRDVYLKAIVCGDFKVTFTKSEQTFITSFIRQKDGGIGTGINVGFGQQQLDKIEIHKESKLISTNQLYYSYFNETIYGEKSYLYQRLRLDSLHTKNHQKIKAMRFKYEEEIKLPSKESHARDLWGYYNGEEDLYNITPSDFFNYSQPEKILQEENKTKHYSLAHIQAGILKSIDYGKGRTTEFTYDHQEFEDIDEEISSYFSEDIQNSNVKYHLNPFIFGGLRIKEVINSYPTDKVYKDFTYKLNGKETGKLIITHYNHAHHGYGHKTSGNHCVKYQSVKIKTGKIFNGKKF